MHKPEAIDYFDVNSSKLGFIWNGPIYTESQTHMVHMVCINLSPQLIVTIQSQDRSDVSGYFKEEQLLRCIFNNIPSIFCKKCRINIMYCGYFF